LHQKGVDVNSERVKSFILSFSLLLDACHATRLAGPGRCMASHIQVQVVQVDT
jgi:hypothetical protein